MDSAFLEVPREGVGAELEVKIGWLPSKPEERKMAAIIFI